LLSSRRASTLTEILHELLLLIPPIWAIPMAVLVGMAPSDVAVAMLGDMSGMSAMEDISMLPVSQEFMLYVVSFMVLL
jgi:hypothetical protein